MRNFVEIVFVLMVFPNFAFGADSVFYFSNKTESTTTVESNENKKIGLSHVTSDIITFEQLLSCSELTLEGKPDIEITSYDILYFLPDNGGFKIYSGTGAKIPDDFIQEIISEGVSEILIENIIAFDHSEKISLGYRRFDLK